jgi:hypothetical protein
MREQPSLGFGSAVTSLVLAVLGLAVAVRLLPLLLQAFWQLAPTLIILWFIVTVLRGMIRKLLVSHPVRPPSVPVTS